MERNERRYVGTTDLHLTEYGKAAVAALKDAMPDLSAARIFCSPMTRTRETCAILFPDAEVTFEPELREVDFGRWENLSFDEVADRDAAMIQQWADDDENFGFPEGDSLRAFRTRVCRCLNTLLAESTTDIVIVAHGGVIRTGICHLLGLPLTDYLMFDVSPASLTTIQTFGDRGILKRMNYQPEG